MLRFAKLLSINNQQFRSAKVKVTQCHLRDCSVQCTTLSSVPSAEFNIHWT